MMFDSNNRWVLVGLTSSGIGCARATSFGIYTRVAAFQDWIASNTDDSASTETTYTTLALSSTTPTTVSTSTTTIIPSHGCTLHASVYSSFGSIFMLVIVRYLNCAWTL